MKLFEITKRYSLAGNCVNSFDDDSCSFSNYVDVTDFAQGEENSIQINKEQFLNKINYNNVVDKCDIFLYDESHDCYIAYNSKKDIHYFFI